MRVVQLSAFERWRGGVEGEVGARKELRPVDADAKLGGTP